MVHTERDEGVYRAVDSRELHLLHIRCRARQAGDRKTAYPPVLQILGETEPLRHTRRRTDTTLDFRRPNHCASPPLPPHPPPPLTPQPTHKKDRHTQQQKRRRLQPNNQPLHPRPKLDHQQAPPPFPSLPLPITLLTNTPKQSSSPSASSHSATTVNSAPGSPN